MSAQLFSPASNTVFRAILAGGVLLLATAGWAVHTLWFSPLVTDVGVPVQQPVPFSHEHHVAGLGIDCRYCHTSVEVSSSAGMPSTETCMTCHSQVWRDAPMLEPVRASWAQNRPIVWNRVNDLPDYTYFNHSIHLAKGIGCVSCHGRVDRMPLMQKAHALYMRWCLDCHRHPERERRPSSELFNMEELPSHDAVVFRREESVVGMRLDQCSICHR